MASRLPITGQGNALLTACQDQEWPRHDSWHAKTRGGQGMASRLLVTGQGNAMLTACQDQGWPRHDKPIACHRARQCIGQGMTHGMPKQRVAKAWQVDCLSPGKECNAHGIRRPRVAKGNALLTACQDQGWPRHDSRHAKTRGGQGMASRLLVTGQGNALLTACQDQG
ncbi:hypothetical protein RHGRI_010908 [Rhododendron griersonianum]|uniref:Uncharacterized protein n=1 Tax=Rhododendron griersonianum TaxID=479676 RepID=A0AAV6KKA8_9ERIC|nr:hypothetical protein RHGRI_010908 [Rhododendron griersonianum]